MPPPYRHWHRGPIGIHAGGHEQGSLGSTEGERVSRALRRKRLGYRRPGWRGAGNWVRTKASNATVGSQRRRANSMRARVPTG
jgi:hypothetical protein